MALAILYIIPFYEVIISHIWADFKLSVVSASAREKKLISEVAEGLGIYFQSASVINDIDSTTP